MRINKKAFKRTARKDENNLWLHCVPLPPSLPHLVDPIFQCGSRLPRADSIFWRSPLSWSPWSHLGGIFKIFWGSAAPHRPASGLHNVPKSRSAIESRGSNRTVLYCNIALFRKLFLTVRIAKNFPRGEGVSGSRYAWRHQAKSRSGFTLCTYNEADQKHWKKYNNCLLLNKACFKLRQFQEKKIHSLKGETKG